MTLAEASIFLGEKQLELYRRNPGVYVDCFCAGVAIRRITDNYYKILTKRGKILYLEVLPAEVKKELKEMALEFSKGRLDSEGALDLCKLLHILTYEGIDGDRNN